MPLATNLNEIRTLGHLFACLVDSLDWEIIDDLSESTFEDTAVELGLPANAVVPESIRTLRPLTAQQPWGIVLLEFGKRKLSIAAYCGRSSPRSATPSRTARLISASICSSSASTAGRKARRSRSCISSRRTRKSPRLAGRSSPRTARP